jgi:hypothetical protein
MNQLRCCTIIKELHVHPCNNWFELICDGLHYLSPFKITLIAAPEQVFGITVLIRIKVLQRQHMKTWVREFFAKESCDDSGEAISMICGFKGFTYFCFGSSASNET